MKRVFSEAIAKQLCTEKSMILSHFASDSSAGKVHPTRSAPGGPAEKNGRNMAQKGDFNGRMCFAIASSILTISLAASAFADTYYSEQSPCRNSLCCSDAEYRTDASLFELFGEYLFWEAREDGLQYATDVKGGLTPLIDFFISPSGKELNEQMRTKESNFEWKSGFRLGAGYLTRCSQWDFQLYWTSFHEHTKADVSDPTGGIIPTQFAFATLFDLIGRGPAPTLATGAQNKWRLNFDTIDLQMGRIFYPAECAEIRPFLGILAAQINQKMRTSYDGIAFTTLTGSLFNVGASVVKKNNFRAIGPSIGVDAGWNFTSHFALIGGAEFACVFGKFNTDIRSSLDFTPVATVNLNSDFDFNRLRPTANGYIGLDLSGRLGCTFGISLSAAYEIQYWWNQWQVPLSAEDSILKGSSPQGDLMLHGLTARLGFYF